MTTLHHPRHNDILILIRYHNEQHPKSIRLGVYRNRKIVQVNAENATCTELLKSYFHVGKFSHTTITLNSLGRYLSRFDWKCLEQTEWEQALTCVRDFAKLLIVHKSKFDLWYKVAPRSLLNEPVSSNLYFNNDSQRWQNRNLKLL